jgi:small subunit ribosomal protein S6
MPFYEHVFMTRQDASNTQVDALTEQFKGVVASGGGKVKNSEYWGVKTLSFRIKKNRKAHFTFFNIDAPPAAIAEMERQMSINEDVIRFMTIRVEALEDGPSVMMKPSRRDDRDEGFGFGGGFGGGGFGGGGGRRGRREEASGADGSPTGRRRAPPIFPAQKILPILGR